MHFRGFNNSIKNRMKKIVLLLGLSFFFMQSVSGILYAKEQKQLTCQEINKIIDSEECQNWIVQPNGVWCNMPPGDFDAWKKYPISYTFPPGQSCGWDDSGQKVSPADEGKQNSLLDEQPKQKKQNNLSRGPALLSIGYEWIESLYLDKVANLINEFKFMGADSQISSEAREWGVSLERKPNLTDEVVNQYKQDKQEVQDSTYRLDGLRGQAQIKLPGQSEWQDLKEGDYIPPGATIFTGMDTTTVLRIRDKGAIQVQSFTEITVSEKGLEEAVKKGQTYTEIKLRTGEVELNVEGGVFTATLQVQTPSVVAGVRGTHFWVSYNKDKKLSTVGVYKGEVEVKTLGSNKPILVSPNGDKPGVVAVIQKLSAVKLILAGLVTVATLGGLVFLFKKKNKKRN